MEVRFSTDLTRGSPFLSLSLALRDSYKLLQSLWNPGYVTYCKMAPLEKVVVVVGLLVVSVLMFPVKTNSARIAVLPFPNGPSHFPMMENIAQQLISRGHEVIYVLCSMDPLFKKTKVKKLMYDVPGYPSNYFVETTALAAFKHGYINARSLIDAIFYILKDICDSLLLDEDLLAQLKGYDLVFADNSFFGCAQLMKEKVGIPLIVDFSAWGLNDVFNWQYGLPWPVSYIPCDPIPSATNMPFHLRVVNLLGYGALRIVGRSLTVFGVSSLKYKHGLAPDKSFTQLIGETDMVLVPLDWALEWTRPIPPNVKMIGSTTTRPAKKLPQDLEDFMKSAGKEGVVLVSFGSMAGEMDEKRFEILKKAFSQLKYKVLWKYPKTISGVENLKTVKWMPQNDILGHPQLRLFMTHGGSNSVSEASYHGVPLLVTPLWGDQFGFAQKVKAAGYGKPFNIRKDAVFSAEEIVDLINDLIENDSFKINALHISKLLKDHPHTPSEQGADWIEYVLNNNGTRHLIPHGVNLPFYQYFLLDVALFTVVVLSTILYILYKCCKCFKRLCSSKAAKQKYQ